VWAGGGEDRRGARVDGGGVRWGGGDFFVSCDWFLMSGWGCFVFMWVVLVVCIGLRFFRAFALSDCGILSALPGCAACGLVWIARYCLGFKVSCMGGASLFCWGLVD